MKKPFPWPVTLARLHPAKRLKLSELNRFFRPRNRYDDCLDVGCGTGGVAFWLRKAGKRWTYVENDDTARQVAEEVLDTPVVSGLESLGSRKFDLITLIDTVFYFDLPNDQLQLLKVLLKPHGELLIMMVDGDPKRAINRLREWFHVGWTRRGFAFQESVSDFRSRVSRLGFEECYFREFSFLMDEIILFLLDGFMIFQSKIMGKVSLSGVSALLESKPVSRSTIVVLYCLQLLLHAITIIQIPLKRLHRGARFLLVLKTQMLQ